MALLGCGGPDMGSAAVEERLRTALRGCRPLEPRLSLDLGYAPCRQAAGGGVVEGRCASLPAGGSKQRKELVGAARAYGRYLDQAPAQTARKGTALLGLVGGTAGGAARAVVELEAAVGAEGRDAAAWNDLTAAYAVRAHLRGEPYDLLRALAAADKALEAEPRREEALFNRALVLDELGLRAPAATAWHRFLAVGRAKGWAEEARAHLARVVRPAAMSPRELRAALRAAALANREGEVARLVGRSAQAAREVASEELLPGWGGALLRGDGAGARQLLGGARAVGEALSGLGGDETVAESVRAVARVQGAGERGLEALARAHAEYGRGLDLYRSLQVEAAGEVLRRARRPLARAGSPMALWAASLVAGADLGRARPEAAAAAFAALLRATDARRLPALRGRLLWGLGLVRGREGRLTEALTLYGQAAVELGRARETVNQARVEALTAEALKYLGQSESAWEHRCRALAVLAELPASRELHGELWEGADALLEDGRPGLALVFQQEDVEVARRSAEPFMRAEAQLRLARVLAALGRSGEGLRALTEARAWNARGGSAATAAGTDAQIDLEESELRRREDPAAAERLADRAAGQLRALRRPLERLLALLSRARARLAGGKDLEAEQDLDVALRLMGDQEAGVREPQFRESFAAAAQGLFDEWIGMRSRRPHAELATLEAIERARGLTSAPLGAAGGRGGGARPSRKRLAAGLERLPEDVAVVEVGLVGDRLFRWTLLRRRLVLRTAPVDGAALAAWVSRFCAAVRTGAGVEEIAKASAPLFPLLVPGGAERVGSEERLVFVPDGELHRLPFAALVDPRTRRYLVEDHVVSVAPSAASYFDALERRVPARVQGWSALLVEEPRFDRAVFPELGAPPGAHEETAIARSAFPGSVVMAGGQATGVRLLEDVGRHEILGFSGHAVANDRVPLESYLVLAPAPGSGDRGRLFARELAGKRFGAVRLVVLSACETAVGVIRGRGAGLLGLTGPFLEGGASAVVATLWNVGDAAAGRMVGDFYRRFRESGDAAAALRGAQLAMVHGVEPRPPAEWAGFLVAGELRQCVLR